MARFLFFHGMRGRVLAVVLLAVLPGFALGVAHAIGNMRHARSMAHDELVSALAETQRTFADAMEDALPDLHLAERDLVQRDRSQESQGCSGAMDNLLKNPAYTDVGLLRSNGQVVCALAKPGNVVTAVPIGLIQDTLHVPGGTSSALISFRDAQWPRQIVLHVIRSGDSVPELIYAASEFNVFHDIPFALSREKLNIITIEAGGHVSEAVHGVNAPRWAIIKDELGTENLHRRLAAAVRPIVLSTKKGLLAMARLGNHRTFSGVLVGVTRRDLYDEAWRDFYRDVLFLVTALIVVLVLLRWLIVNKFIRPTQALVDAAKAVALGHLGARTGLQHGTDEFARIAAAFDDMAQEIDQKTQQNLRHLETERRANRLHAMLAAINVAIVRRENAAQLMRDICRIACDVGRMRQAWISELDPATNVARPVCWEGPLPTELASSALIWSLDCPSDRAQAPSAEAAWTGLASVNNRLCTDPSTAPLHAYAREMGIGSSLALPLGKTPSGQRRILVLGAPEEDYFEAEEMQILEQLAHDAAFGLHLIETEQQLAQVSDFDQATGLPNEKQSMLLLQAAIDRATADGKRLAVGVLDVDFQSIVGHWGSTVGNVMFELVGQEVQAACESTRHDLDKGAGVLFGARFALLIGNVDTLGTVEQSLDALVERLQQLTVSTEHGLVNLVPKVGVAIFPDDGQAATDLNDKALVAVDLARYEKDTNVMFFSPQMLQTKREKLRLEQDLQGAIERGELVLHYQPILALKSGTLRGFEALLRWVHPELGNIPPDQFIALAERTGLIVPIGDWVIQEVARQAAIWDRLVSTELFISINVSAIQLQDVHLAERMGQVMAAPGMKAKLLRLALEVTESHLLADIDGSVAMLNRFKALGVAIIIDDFGTGYSSLSYVHRLPVDIIKIDKSFVGHVDTSAQDQKMVTGILALSRSIGLETVVEGIERDAQLQVMEAMGCTYGQGFLFDRALPADQTQQKWLLGSDSPISHGEAKTQWEIRARGKSAEALAERKKLRTKRLSVMGETEQMKWARRLMEAATPLEVASLIVKNVVTWPACKKVSLLWGDGDNQPIGASVTPAVADWAQGALSGEGYCYDDLERKIAWRLLPRERVVLLLYFSSEQRESALRAVIESNLALASERLRLALELAALKNGHKGAAD